MRFDKPKINKLLPMYEVQHNDVTHEMTNNMSDALSCLNAIGTGAKLFEIQGGYKVELSLEHLRNV